MTNDPIYLEGITKDADMITVDTIADTEYFGTVYFSNKPTVNVLSYVCMCGCTQLSLTIQVAQV